MKCPILLLSYHMGYTTTPRTKADCLKEECAWWVKPRGQCVLIALEEHICEVDFSLRRVEAKMPHARRVGIPKGPTPDRDR